MPDDLSSGGMPPLLRGLFGVGQVAAQQHLPTSRLWAEVRIAAARGQRRIQGLTGHVSRDFLEQRGREILSQQGIGIMQMNALSRSSHGWLAARNRLADLEPGAQITGRQIFTPEWATSGGEGESPTFRARVEWQLEDQLGRPFTATRVYPLGTTLTSPEQVLQDARNQFGLQPDTDIPPGSTVTGVNGFEIEQE